MAEAGKDCGGDWIVKERTQTNVCKAQRSPSVENVRLMMSVEKEGKERESRKIREKPSLDRFGLVIAASVWEASHDARGGVSFLVNPEAITRSREAMRDEDLTIGLVYRRHQQGPGRSAAQWGVAHYPARHSVSTTLRHEPLTWFHAVLNFLGTKKSQSRMEETDLYFKHPA